MNPFKHGTIVPLLEQNDGREEEAGQPVVSKHQTQALGEGRSDLDGRLLLQLVHGEAGRHQEGLSAGRKGEVWIRREKYAILTYIFLPFPAPGKRKKKSWKTTGQRKNRF